MTPLPHRLLKAHQLADVPAQPRFRLADLSDASNAASRFEPLDFNVSQSHSSREPSAENSASLHTAIEALANAVTELQSQRDLILEQAQHETIKLGIAIAGRLLRRTLSAQPEAVLELVRATLNWTVGAATVRVRMHPADCDLVEPQLDSLSRDCSAKIEFLRDDTLTRGDCIAETAHGIIDSRVEAMLDRIAEELLT